MAPPSQTAASVTRAISSETHPLCFSDAIATSAGSIASVAVAAATVGTAVVVTVEIPSIVMAVNAAVAASTATAAFARKLHTVCSPQGSDYGGDALVY